MEKILQDYLEKKEIALSDLNEETWDEIASEIPEEMLTDEVLEYLVSNELGVISLAHRKLPEKWLIKLSRFDTMPMYTLAYKYYLNDEISEKEFVDFFERYLGRYPDIVSLLLRIYEQSSKRTILIELCKKSENICLQEYGRDYGLAENVKKLKSSAELSKIYEANRNNPVVLKAIAGNRFTDPAVLEELTRIQKINGAKSIRAAARESMKKT